MTQDGQETVLLLDNSIQVDRVKSGERASHIATVVSGYGFTLTTGIALLEFKAVVIQECITIHNALRRTGAKFTTVRDQLLESQHRQAKLRSHIFNNLINLNGSSFSITDEKDVRLAEKARLILEVHIPELYRRFNQNVDSVINDGIKCNRATEAPERRQAVFSTNLPVCVRGKNKSCLVESFVRGNATQLVSALSTVELSEQLVKSLQKISDLKLNKNLEWSHSDCRSVGDCLITLEGSKVATHALSTNAVDWKPLSEATGMEYVDVSYPRRN